MDLTYLLNMIGLGGPGSSYAKPQPGASVPKGLQTTYANPNPPPQDTLADAIGPWDTTVTPATPVDAASPAAPTGTTFGDKLSSALSGLGKLNTPGVTPPDPADALAIGKFLLSAVPKSGFLALSDALASGGRR
jgi:hypothetical protein